MALDQGVFPLRSAEQHEIFAQQPDGLYRAGRLQLVNQSGRLPIHPQQLAGRGAWPAPRHQSILFGGHHRPGLI